MRPQHRVVLVAALAAAAASIPACARRTDPTAAFLRRRAWLAGVQEAQDLEFDQDRDAVLAAIAADAATAAEGEIAQSALQQIQDPERRAVAAREAVLRLSRRKPEQAEAITRLLEA